MPGDLLKVELLNLGSLDGDELGFTGTFAQVSVLPDYIQTYDTFNMIPIVTMYM